MTALKVKGVPSILLKGFSVAGWLYQPEEARWNGDIDLLVEPAQLKEASAILTGLGYELIPDESTWTVDPHAQNLVRSKDNLHIDLHSRIRGFGRDPSEAWSELGGLTSPFSVRGHDISVLNHSALALHVVLHAAQHGPLAPKPLEDLRRVLERCTDDEWKSIHALAQRLDAEQAFAEGLGLLSEGADVLALLCLTPPSALDVHLRAESAPATAFHIQEVMRVPKRSLPKEIWHRVFPSRAYMRQRYGIPAGRPLRRAYLTRIMQLASELPRTARLLWSNFRGRRSG